MTVVRRKTVKSQCLTQKETFNFLVRNLTVADDAHHIEVTRRILPHMMLTGIALASFLHPATAYRTAAFHIVRSHFQLYTTVLNNEPCLKRLATLVLHFHHVGLAITEQLTANLLRHFHPMHLVVDDELATSTLLCRAIATESQRRLHHVTATHGTLTDYFLFCHFLSIVLLLVSLHFVLKGIAIHKSDLPRWLCQTLLKPSLLGQVHTTDHSRSMCGFAKQVARGQY